MLFHSFLLFEFYFNSIILAEMKRSRKDEDWFWEISAELDLMTDRVMRRFASVRGLSGRQVWEPNADVLESEEGFTVFVELAGINPEELKIYYSPTRHALLVRGSRKQPSTFRCHKCYQLEMQYGQFEKLLILPSGSVQRDGIKAKFENGILQILVPKKERTPRRRNILIESEPES